MNKVERRSGSLGGQSTLRGAYVVRTYSLLAFLSLGLFGAFHVVQEPQLSVGYLELAGSVIILVNVAFSYILRNVALTRSVFLLTVLAFMVVMLTTGGTGGTGIFWFFVFPVAAFFLSGKRQGLWWMVALFAASIITWLFGAKGTIPFAYGSVTVRQLLVSMLVVTVGIYAYQRSLEQLVGQKEESQRDLQSEKVRADEIVKHIGEGIVTTDAAGTVTFANDPAQKLLGWKIEELKGKSFVETVPMQDEFGGVIPAERRPLRRAIRAGETTVTMATYRSKDGRAIPVSVTATPVIVEDRVIGAIGTFRDITEEQAIARAKSEFVTLASHQLRTPISAISWVSELLLSGDAGKLSSEQHEHIAGIYQSNQRMAALVSEMLMVSSLELGTLSITPEQTDLAALAAKTLKERLSSQSSSNRAQEVTERYDPDLPAVPCDPEATKLVFNNLISNALKYTPSTGRITLELAVDRHEKLHAGSNGSIVFRISDTGYGIPEKVTDKIFSKFFRADNIVHKDTDGTGLGLYIVKALLDYVGGRVSFTSRENQGTTFTVLIPLEGMARRQPGQSQAASSVAKAAHA